MASAFFRRWENTFKFNLSLASTAPCDRSGGLTRGRHQRRGRGNGNNENGDVKTSQIEWGMGGNLGLFSAREVANDTVNTASTGKNRETDRGNHEQILQPMPQLREEKSWQGEKKLGWGQLLEGQNTVHKKGA